MSINNKAMVRNTHTLISITSETRAGVCDHCGPTKIAKTGKFKDIQYWGCSYAHTKLDADGNPKVNTFVGEVQNKATGRNGHTLSSFELEGRSGTCDRCGLTTIVKCGSNPGVQYWACAFAYPRKTATVNIHRHELSDINSATRDATCSQCGPTQVIKNGGSWICRHSRGKIVGGLNLESYKRHQLSEIDADKRRAVCANCGPVDINKAGTKDDGVKRWRCQFAHALKPKSVDHPKQHFLELIDEVQRTAVCSKCGPVKIVKRGEVGGKTYWKCLASFRWLRLSQRYGMKEETYFKMVEDQGGLCAICKQDKDLCVDHEHLPGDSEQGRVYGKIRGLLCVNCNTMLGHAYDSIPVLESAIAYLRHHTPPAQIEEPDGPDHQQRVIQEKADLDEKLEKLIKFIGYNPLFSSLPAAEKERLIRQRKIMLDLSDVLNERIAAFTK